MEPKKSMAEAAKQHFYSFNVGIPLHNGLGHPLEAPVMCLNVWSVNDSDIEENCYARDTRQDGAHYLL